MSFLPQLPTCKYCEGAWDGCLGVVSGYYTMPRIAPSTATRLAEGIVSSEPQCDSRPGVGTVGYGAHTRLAYAGHGELSRLGLLSRLGFQRLVILEGQSHVMKLASCRGVEVWEWGRDREVGDEPCSNGVAVAPRRHNTARVVRFFFLLLCARGRQINGRAVIRERSSRT
jgi:hypothetical protein